MINIKRNNLKYVSFLLILILTAAVSAQDDETISVSTEIINVSVAVSDGAGKSVRNLSKSDFELFDNKKKTQIDFFSGQNAPISYGIVYDLHPTTTEQTSAILSSLRAFTKNLVQNEDFFVTVFNEYGSLNINFVPTEEQIRRHLSFGERNEPNSLYDAVYFAGNKLRTRVNQKKTLIIISDGKDHQSHHSYKELERLFDSFSVQIYAVILDEEDSWGYGDVTMGEEVKRLELDDSLLKKAAIRELSKDSGGNLTSTQSRNAVDLFEIFESIAGEMRGRYSIGFYPSNGQKHEVEVRVKSENSSKLKLNYQKSFQLPAAQ